ncbi:MAG: YceI family protein [Sulfurimonas sp.]|nr:YceI family protein [Sulfurimonas sp.]
MKFFTLAFIALFFGVGSLLGAAFTVDVSHTNVAFKVKHMMISTVNGEFQKFSGSFELDDKTKALKALSGDIDVASINTNIDKRDEHLRSDELFDAQKYPKITFVLDKVKGDKVYGKLTIKDVTKDVVLDYEFGGIVKDPWGNTRAGLSLSGEINRLDYNIKWNKVLETGGVAVSEKVKLEINIEGIEAK